MEEAKALFLRFSGDEEMGVTPFGTVLRRTGNRTKARIYVNGLRVAEEDNFLFSYNITSPTAALRRALNRERSNVGRSAYTDRVKSILLACDQDDVIDALVADLQKQAHGVVGTSALPVLAHPALRPVVDAQLGAVGRVVIEHRDADGAVEGYSSGYADDIAEQLAAEGLGVLPPLERAVVALVLLRCLAMPAARGQAPHRWSAAPPVRLARLQDNRAVGNTVITEAVNRLHDQHVLVNGRAAGIRPGPAFDRLTVSQRRRIEEDLFILAAPADPVAGALLRQRSQEEPQ